MSDDGGILEDIDSQAMPEDRVEVIEGQVKMIREACGVIQINAEELADSNANIDKEFLEDLQVWAGKVSLGTYKYVDEDGVSGRSDW